MAHVSQCVGRDVADWGALALIFSLTYQNTIPCVSLPLSFFSDRIFKSCQSDHLACMARVSSDDLSFGR